MSPDRQEGMNPYPGPAEALQREIDGIHAAIAEGRKGRGDLSLAVAGLQKDVGHLNGDLTKSRAELRAEILAMRTDLARKIDEMRDGEIKPMRRDLDGLKNRDLERLGVTKLWRKVGLAVAIIGGIAAVLVNIYTLVA